MTAEVETTLALRGWNAVIGAAILISGELLLVMVTTAPLELFGFPLLQTTAERERFAICFQLALCLVGFSFAVARGPVEFVGRIFAIAFFALPPMLLVSGAPTTAATYAALLVIQVSIAIWFLDRNVPEMAKAKRAVLLFYGGVWIALTIDAVGRYTTLGFAKAIPLHPALGAFNDFRLMVGGGILASWLVGAFVATAWGPKLWRAPLTNPFAKDRNTGTWWGIRDGLEWLAYQGFVAVDIAYRALWNAQMLLKCYAGHLFGDYIKPVFDKGYLAPLLRLMLSVAVVGGYAIGAKHVASVLVDYLQRPSGVAATLFGDLGAGVLVGRELLSLGQMALFILIAACCIVFEAWNWSVGGKAPEITRRIVIVLGIVMVSFAVTGVLAVVLSWSAVGVIGPGIRYGGLVSAAAVGAVLLFILGLVVSRRRSEHA
jgi:hypothetical protein